MPRANRFYIPKLVWHITHRCHDRKFLLKFERDRVRWRYWLFKARARYGLSILNFIVTSNHVHLLVRETERGCIARSMQLVAARTGQEYNRRKRRRGAFWEDRYFATAVETDNHLIRCLVYIDLNMVRAGKVDHPSDWKVCGFNEIQSPLKRYRVIDLEVLCQLTGSPTLEVLQKAHLSWVEHELQQGGWAREPRWTEPVAVGSKRFVEELHARLGHKACHRPISPVGSNSYVISE